MTRPDPKKPRQDTDSTTATDGKRTGEGARSAFEAMLRKRKQAELPEPPDTAPPPAPPA